MSVGQGPKADPNSRPPRGGAGVSSPSSKPCQNGEQHRAHAWSPVPFESDLRAVGYHCPGVAKPMGRHVAVNPATEGHDHVAVQFRDGKEPHCRVCGLTSDGRTPVSRLVGPGNQARPPHGGAGGSQPGRMIR